MKPIKGLLTQTLAAASIFATVAATAPDEAKAQGIGIYLGGGGIGIQVVPNRMYGGHYGIAPRRSLRHHYNGGYGYGSRYGSGCNVPWYLPNGNTGGTYNACRGQTPPRGWGSGPMMYRW